MFSDPQLSGQHDGVVDEKVGAEGEKGDAADDGGPCRGEVG
ncbi:MAG: hypothetical protein PHF19_05860 [Synergistales bacterium]|nr:hypothetical protein [Synergistales bacterium]